MFDGLLKKGFYSKCKNSIKMTKTRLQMIKKKRNAMEKYLKNDLVDLLKNGLYVNAYGRVEGFLVELNMSGCYDLIEQFCILVSSHLHAMEKQRDCPEDCREAVSSLMFAAARFADLPELRDLRSIFNQKYGGSLDGYVNKQFAEKLKRTPPTKDMKLQLLQKTAGECGIDWNLKAVEQKLYKPPPSGQGHNNYVKDNQHGSRGNSTGKVNIHAANSHGELRGHIAPTRNKENLLSQERKEELHRNRNKPIPVEELHRPEGTLSKDIHTSSAKQNDEKNKSDSVKSVRHENDENKPFYNRFINPPYSRAKPSLSKPKGSLDNPSDDASLGKAGSSTSDGRVQGEDGSVSKAEPKPRSVRRNRARLETVSSAKEDARGDFGAFGMRQKDDDRRDEEERMVDNLLMHYSRKKSPNVVGKANLPLKPPPAVHAAGLNRPLKLPPAMQTAALASDAAKLKDKRAPSLPSESSHPKPTRGHVRAISFEPVANPMLPDYDDFMKRLKSLTGN